MGALLVTFHEGLLSINFNDSDAGTTGNFEVTIKDSGALIFSKQTNVGGGGFPTTAEKQQGLLDAIKEHLDNL